MFGGEGESDKQLSVAVPQSQSTPSPLHCPRACKVTCKELVGSVWRKGAAGRCRAAMLQLVSLLHAQMCTLLAAQCSARQSPAGL